MVQTRYLVTDGKGKFAVASTGTIHLSEVHNWVDVKVFKEFNTAKKCIERNEHVLRNCYPVKMRIIYADINEDANDL